MGKNKGLEQLRGRGDTSESSDESVRYPSAEIWYEDGERSLGFERKKNTVWRWCSLAFIS